MKKKILFFLCLIFSLQFINADSIDLSVGGAFTGYFIPTINYFSYESTLPRIAYKSESVNLLFGMALTVPVTFTYYFNNDWGVGAAVEMGYSLQGGPHVWLKNPPVDYVPTDYSYLFNAFYGVFDFAAKTPRFKYDIRLLMEFGLTIRAGGLVGFYRGNRSLFTEGLATSDFRALGYVGPNFFIGIQKEVVKSLILQPGFRFSAEFAGYNYAYIGGYAYNELYVQINFGLELRIMWNKNFPLSSGGGSTTNSTTKTKTKTKTNTTNKNNDDYK
jgi:hypothetical protein